MLHNSPTTAERFAEEYDRNGDSYTKDLTVDSLKQVFNTMEDKLTVSSTITSQLTVATHNIQMLSVCITKESIQLFYQ